MKRSTDGVLTTHTGSLPLPEGIRRSLAAKRRGEAYDPAALDAALTTGIHEIVRRQIEAGVDIVNDGELSKTSWNDYVVHRVSGLEKRFHSRARGGIRGAWNEALCARATQESREAMMKTRRVTFARTSRNFTI